MQEPLSSLPQIQDLSLAISRLLPAICALEKALAEANSEAVAKQQRMIDTLDRMSLALEQIVTHQDMILRQFSGTAQTLTITQETMQELNATITVEQRSRENLIQQISALAYILDSPA